MGPVQRRRSRARLWMLVGWWVTGGWGLRSSPRARMSGSRQVVQAGRPTWPAACAARVARRGHARRVVLPRCPSAVRCGAVRCGGAAVRGCCRAKRSVPPLCEPPALQRHGTPPAPTPRLTQSLSSSAWCSGWLTGDLAIDPRACPLFFYRLTNTQCPLVCFRLDHTHCPLYSDICILSIG